MSIPCLSALFLDVGINQRLGLLFRQSPHILLEVFDPRVWWCILIAGTEGRAMGQVLHGSATTTEAIRRAIQNSQASLRTLAERHGINPKTVAKWRKRDTTADRPTGPRAPHSTVLSVQEEAIGVAFRRHTLLPLDDCLYALQPTIPHLTRSSLHRCLQRHGISRLPEVTGDKPAKKKFKAYPIGYFHIDIAEVRTEQGRLYLLVAIDRTSKFVFAQLHEKATRRVAGDFLRALIATAPYKVHTVLADNGTHFTSFGTTSSAAPLIKEAMEKGELFRAHAFEYACAQNEIDHRLTKPRHPWTNGQVERMNRTLKDATVRRYYYDTHDQLRGYLGDFFSIRRVEVKRIPSVRQSSGHCSSRGLASLRDRLSSRPSMGSGE
jgi:hypothetical protein